ncbi:MAG TPA: hypothetical protein VM686_31040, partial [Polyangiaceae bacterium]|nr:hypothetical protein [Polyangiaceae bacterium]
RLVRASFSESATAGSVKPPIVWSIESATVMGYLRFLRWTNPARRMSCVVARRSSPSVERHQTDQSSTSGSS